MLLGTFRDDEAQLVREWLRRTPYPVGIWCGHRLMPSETNATYMVVDDKPLVAITCPLCLAVESFDIGLPDRCPHGALS